MNRLMYSTYLKFKTNFDCVFKMRPLNRFEMFAGALRLLWFPEEHVPLVVYLKV